MTFLFKSPFGQYTRRWVDTHARLYSAIANYVICDGVLLSILFLTNRKQSSIELVIDIPTTRRTLVLTGRLQ